MVRSYSVLSGVIESVLGFLGLFWVFRVSVLGKCKHNRHGRGVTDRVKEGSRIISVALEPWKYVFPIYPGWRSTGHSLIHLDVVYCLEIFMTGLGCWVWVRGLGVLGLEARFGVIGFLFRISVYEKCKHNRPVYRVIGKCKHNKHGRGLPAVLKRG